jgi:hypothetical protein
MRANCVTPYMRINVFPRGSNPAMNPPNQRKSESYCTAEVEAARGDWVDPGDHAKGMLCRAMFSHYEPLPFYEPSSPRNNKRIPGFGSTEVGALHFRQPSDPAWQEQHGMATHSLRARAYMTLKAWKLQFEVPAPPII